MKLPKLGCKYQCVKESENKEKRKQMFIEDDERVKKTFVQNGVNENQVHLSFHRYILNKQIKKIKEYFDVGYDVNVKDLWGRSALYYAIFSGDVGIVKLLIKAGGDYTFKDSYFNGASLLHFAASEGYLDIVKYLVEELYLDVNGIDNVGQNVLAYSMLFEQLEIAEYLIYHDANYGNISLIENADILFVYLIKQLNKLKKNLKKKKIIPFDDMCKMQKLISIVRFYN